MPYVIGERCIDAPDRTSVEEYPLDCVYEVVGARYIHPHECVDGGAGALVCPVEAISCEDVVPERWHIYTADNARFFTEWLSGRTEPLVFPGGAATLGPVGVDTELVANQAAAQNAEP